MTVMHVDDAIGQSTLNIVMVMSGLSGTHHGGIPVHDGDT